MAESGWKAKSEQQERDLREACALLRDFAGYIEDSQAILNGNAVGAAIRLVCDQVVPPSPKQARPRTPQGDAQPKAEP